MEFLGDFNVELNQQVAARTITVRVGHPLTLQAKHVTSLRSGWDDDVVLSRQDRDIHFCPQCRLRKRNRHFAHQIASVTLKQ